MDGDVRRRRWVMLALASVVSLAVASSASAKLGVTWMKGYAAPGTPAKYDKVGVIKVGSSHARNVLVLEPGTSGGGGYFVPLAQWIVSRAPGWQVWSVERRENLLEDQSVLNLAKEHKVTVTQMFDYYLGYLADPSITHHDAPVPDSAVPFARQWGLKVAVEDLHDVIGAAGKLGGRVVLGGHSLGGSVVTAYATWNFGGKPGADELAGLVYDDGGSSDQAVSASNARTELSTLSKSTPWLAFSGVPAPLLGLFSAVGSTAALIAPDAPSAAQSFALTPPALKPPVPATNLGTFGFDTDVKTSQLTFAAQAHIGQLNTSVSPAGWSSAGAITPIDRWASMLSGTGMTNVDGSEWYFPQRLTVDTGAVDQGNANPAQKVLGVTTTMGHELPKSLRIYAFGAYGGTAITQGAAALAKQSRIPRSHLLLVSRKGTYAHNDPASAYPHNVFFSNLMTFLAKIAKG
ncbi:MAG TPA: alpha/beta hydrolase [Solirubrobacteraceae bacterium]|jgi:pimeloyl-ACP methyl ester carboxylesterase|nr:alpha/beta hydrolase [Solirubrobacteraceae bacterium]